ncbi:hypothetical protein Taro_042854 [Colocasia esculenta]|uniref:Pectinesterase n=1 Tax=Colocasia esculenta TaxID=4460 RepID=A0A843WU00_COLES|nr:hypothetical protein [Colocasia esculenta]
MRVARAAVRVISRPQRGRRAQILSLSKVCFPSQQRHALIAEGDSDDVLDTLGEAGLDGGKGVVKDADGVPGAGGPVDGVVDEERVVLRAVIKGDGFVAKDITFRNTAGPANGQALALRVAADKTVFYRCSIQGYQDTLYAHAFRQFYSDCSIYGTIDFIFGNAAAVFQNCSIVLRRPKPGGGNVIMANSRTDPGQITGLVAHRCTIKASPEFYPFRHWVGSFLGRPWKVRSTAVIMESNIDDSIHPRGWLEWSGSFALDTLYFAEYHNNGPGADTSGRVTWPGFHILDVRRQCVPVHRATFHRRRYSNDAI